VLLVEQNVRVSLEIADYTYVLDNGTVAYSGPAAELAADDARVQALAGASAEEWTIEWTRSDCLRLGAASVGQDGQGRWHSASIRSAG
jgi:hypothetical protein